MDKIKIIDTSKCKLLAVMVSEGASDFCIPPDIYLEPTLQWWISVNGIVEEVDSVDLPEGNWQILGLSTELTEEQWKEVVKFVGLPWCAYKDYRSNSNWFNTAKESGLSLLEANQCYSVNPLSFDPTGLTTSEWAYNESNTGNWIILKQL